MQVLQNKNMDNVHSLNLFRVVDKYNKNGFAYQLQPEYRTLDRYYLLGLCKWYHITEQRELEIVIEKETYKKWRVACTLVKLRKDKK